MKENVKECTQLCIDAVNLILEGLAKHNIHIHDINDPEHVLEMVRISIPANIIVFETKQVEIADVKKPARSAAIDNAIESFNANISILRAQNMYVHDYEDIDYTVNTIRYSTNTNTIFFEVESIEMNDDLVL